MRRLAIVILVVITLFMGVLGWILGRPGVLSAESQVLAAPASAPQSQSGAQSSSSDAPSMGGGGGGAGFSEPHIAHGDVRSD